MARRWVYRTLLLFGLTAFAVAPSALAQQGSVERVFYRDRTQDGKIVDSSFEIKESAKGVELIVGGKTKQLISPADVVKIDYGNAAGVTKADQLKAMAIEDTKDAGKTLAEYSDLVKKAGTGAPEKTRRYLQFREATWATKVADSKADAKDFLTEATKVAAKWDGVIQISKKSWEVWPASRTAARLQMELGFYDKAAAILATLGNIKELPLELQFEAKLAEAAATLRANPAQGLTVEGLLDQIEKDKDFPTGPLKDRLVVLKAVTKVPVPKGDAVDPKAGEAVAKLRDAVEAAKDPIAKAVGYNFLGDAYAAMKQSRDAQWSYLWVDTVFNQDVDERVIACRKLIEIFDLGSDEASKERTVQFRDKLPRVR